MDPLLSTTEAAAYLRLRPQTLRAWRWRGDGPPYVRLGQSKTAKVVYRSSDLAAWLDARVHEDTSKEGTAA